jgi:undecaprenyl-diphosphatase
MNVDDRILLWITGLAGKFGPLDWAASHLTNDFLIPAVITLVAVCLWFTGGNREERRRNQWGALFAFGGIAFASAAVAIISAHYFRPRPYVEFPQLLPMVDRLFYQPTVSSFPSFPAAVTFAAAFGVWLENRKVGYILLGLAALMGLARIYVGVHYPSDIVGGAAIGILITLILSRRLILARPAVNLLFSVLERLFLA